ncbi:MAG: hypothetical protein R3348_09475, partial [Xanthomonadales bacterium]|nr:hypothetical protein [Xanthomonadales bacterium]
MEHGEADDKKLFFHSRRHRGEKGSFELHRCFNGDGKVLFSAHATRLGKPMPVFRGSEQVAEVRNRKHYLVNGRTDIISAETGGLIGSYARLGRLYDGEERKVGRWRDGRKWSEEFKENFADALANAVFGGGEVPAGVNAGNTQLLAAGKDILCVLQRERLTFFPDPPKSAEPGKLARLASKVV